MIGPSSTFTDFVNVLITVIDGLMTLAVTVIIIIFAWRILTAWFIGGGDPKEIERGRQSAFSGLLVLIVVLGLWGLVRILKTTFFG